jgi:hypothetical protein
MEGHDLREFVKQIHAADYAGLGSIRIHQTPSGQMKYSINQGMWTLPKGERQAS